MSIIALDQGTTSTRAMRFGAEGRVEAMAARALAQSYPEPGWVEQDPEAIWRDACAVIAGVMDDGVTALGIANQRETVVVWDRRSGAAIHPAIVWQDRRTAATCAALRAEGLSDMIHRRTGLVIDPYFTATKLAWILDHVPGARARAERGELAAGTVESFLVWRLTGGARHVSDLTNASRTMLLDLARCAWDTELLGLFRIPEAVLPQLVGNAEVVGETLPGQTGRALPIAGLVGDQQGALVGQGCFAPGSAKATYGTGCFLLANIGARPVVASSRLLTTLGYRIGGETAYALEGAIFAAGSILTWLRDGLGLIADIGAAADKAAQVPDDHGVTLVPAFSGLGAPHWLDAARAQLSGFTLDTRPEHLVRAALDACAHQTGDLVDAIAQDSGLALSLLRVDGGMMANDWLAQHVADLIALPVERPAHPEATALGAACLAGLATGLWPDIVSLPVQDRSAITAFAPRPMPARQALRAGWTRAIAAVRADAARLDGAQWSEAVPDDLVEIPC